MCSCDTTYGLGGADCNSFSPGEIPILIITVVSLLIDAWVSSVVLWLLLGACKVGRQVNSIETTLGFDFIASISGIAVNILFIVKLCGAYPRAPDGKSENNGELGNIAFATFFAFSTFAALNVSQAWARVAMRAKRMSDGFRSRYERVLTVYFALFITAMIVLFALTLDTLVTYACIPAILYVTAAYGYASFSLEQLLKQSIEFGNKYGTDDVQIKSALKAVAASARQLSITAVLAIVFLAANAVIGTEHDLPGNPVGWTVLRPAYLMGSLINLLVQRYITLHTTTGKALAAHKPVHDIRTTSAKGDATGSSAGSHAAQIVSAPS